MDRPRHFVARRALAGRLRDGLRASVLARMKPDEGYGQLTPVGIVLPTDARLGHSGMCQERALDLSGVDVFATRDDQVRAAIKHIEIPIRVKITQITSANPTLLHDFSRHCWPIRVPPG